MLIHAGRLVASSVPLAQACQVALVLPLTDDRDMRKTLNEVIAVCV
jgi:nitric oxide reductase NorQ protein